MNTADLCLTDPNIAQLAIDDRRRGIQRFSGSTTVPLDYGWGLRLQWDAKATPIGQGSMRGFLGVEHDVVITSSAIVSPDGRIVSLPADFVPRPNLDEHAREIEVRLDAEQWDGGGL